MTAPTTIFEKLETGIEGLDQISYGGLPKGRATLVAGTAGSAKTVLAAQYLAKGITEFNQPGVFVTFEESPADLRRNMSGFGWNISEWEENKLWSFVDASPVKDQHSAVSGEFDFGGLLSRINHAIKETNATRLSMDSIGAVFSQFDSAAIVRRELFSLAESLKDLGVTSVVTAERTHDYGEISRFGVEEFVADNVILLRNVLEEEKRRRTIEILKFRGTNHQKGECPFTVIAKEGLALLPLSSMELTQKSSTKRISSGIELLDNMCGGGFFQDSIILISGATGTGKSLTTTHFVNNEKEGGRSLLFGFEESRDQLIRNAAGWGMDFASREKEGKLKIICQYPEIAALEDHLIWMQEAIDEFKPTRVAVDSLSALERISVIKNFREFVLSLTETLKRREIAGLFTSTTPSLLGGQSVTEAHISTITDSIILLRYVEMFGEMKRGLTVLKMRGSAHDKNIREYVIDEHGMGIGQPFTNVTGILSGNPMHVGEHELHRLETMFDDSNHRR
ncbi:MAG: circadian clock protein KaiC [Candidatus Melainabacteria bacterium]|nr:circadian clock protein KaiC [Candidatus Melainabacteria bacterium]